MFAPNSDNELEKETGMAETGRDGGAAGRGGMGGFCMGGECSAVKALEFPAVLLC